ncbi:MAG: DJ-1/PfpI family protein [Devosiaceae bacterium]|nr:DJ-1/PfpI family protein [Devosiaceae bacterium MH13]
MIVYEGFQLLDLSGPVSVFDMANWLAGRTAYDIVIASTHGGLISGSSPPRMETVPLGDLTPEPTDTVLVVGGRDPALANARADQDLLTWLRNACDRVERMGSVCTGSFILAQAGILTERRATTHWASCGDFAGAFPETSVEPESVYVVDDKIWTSAGVTTGIDLCLAMVDADLGQQIMSTTAKRLVVHMRRTSGQSQLSPMLDAQARAGQRFSDLVAWIDTHLHEPICVADMADSVGMTERTFHRRFVNEVGTTPSKFVERARLDRARHLLTMGGQVKDVASTVGYRSEKAFRTAYRLHHGNPPSQHVLRERD